MEPARELRLDIFPLLVFDEMTSDQSSRLKLVVAWDRRRIFGLPTFCDVLPESDLDLETGILEEFCDSDVSRTPLIWEEKKKTFCIE